MKKVIIVDDESSGRKLIKEYLSSHPELILIGEANNGVDAIKIINEFKPDLVFIDVQMPGLTGFEVLERIEELPIIIFSTAYDKYALKAFDAHATDYLLKPYTKQRFDAAIAKVKFDGSNKIIDLAEDLFQSKQQYPERIIVEKGNKYINTAVDDITHFEAFGDYSKIYTLDNTYLSSKGLGELEQRLNPETFLRIHRSFIVNWTAVDVIDKQGKSYLLSLKNKVQLRVSRNNLHLIRDKIL